MTMRISAAWAEIVEQKVAEVLKIASRVCGGEIAASRWSSQ